MFLAKSSLRGRRPLAKTLKLAVWAFSLIFLHDSTLFVIDIYQNMPISLISTPFDHFQLRLTLAVNPNLILEPCRTHSDCTRTAGDLHEMIHKALSRVFLFQEVTLQKNAFFLVSQYCNNLFHNIAITFFTILQKLFRSACNLHLFN